MSWWRHQMETFSALLAFCAGNSPVPGEFPTQRPVTQSFDVFFDPRVNKRLSKQPWGWWFETLSCPLWRHRDVCTLLYSTSAVGLALKVSTHWNKNVVILTKFSSLAALEVVTLTTSSAASDDNFIKMKTFPFLCGTEYFLTHSLNS